MLRWLAAGAVGAAVGFGVGRSAPRPSPPPAPVERPAPRAFPGPRAAVARRIVAEAPPDAPSAPPPAADDAERLRLPWPDELPEGEVDPDAFPAWADAAAAACGGAVDLVDCDAYPCVAVVDDVDPSCAAPEGGTFVTASLPCGGGPAASVTVLVADPGAVPHAPGFDGFFEVVRAAARRVDDVVLQSLDRCADLP